MHATCTRCCSPGARRRPSSIVVGTRPPCVSTRSAGFYHLTQGKWEGAVYIHTTGTNPQTLPYPGAHLTPFADPISRRASLLFPNHGRKTPASSSLQHADACVTLVDIAGESVTYLSVRVSSVHMLAAPYYLIAGAHGARGDWPRAAFEPAQRARAVPPPHRTRTVGQGRSSAPLPSPHARIPLAAVGCGKGQPVGWGWSTGRASPHWVVAAPPDSSTACPPAVARGPESTTVTHTHSPRTSPWTVRARAGASAAACIARTISRGRRRRLTAACASPRLTPVRPAEALPSVLGRVRACETRSAKRRTLGGGW